MKTADNTSELENRQSKSKTSIKTTSHSMTSILAFVAFKQLELRKKDENWNIMIWFHLNKRITVLWYNKVESEYLYLVRTDDKFIYTNTFVNEHLQMKNVGTEDELMNILHDDW